MWTRPFSNVVRTGFEVTAYMMNKNTLAKKASTWTTPSVRKTRSGFEVTAYMMVKPKA